MTNIRLTYEYTLNSIKTTSESIDKINTKLTLVLSFSGVIINFGKDLPEYSTVVQCQESTYNCLSCYVLQLLSYILIISAIAISLVGFLPTGSGKTILPSQLIEEDWKELAEDEYLSIIIPYLEKETLLDLDRLSKKKGKILTYAIIAVSGSVLLLGLDKILGMTVPVLEKIC